MVNYVRTLRNMCQMQQNAAAAPLTNSAARVDIGEDPPLEVRQKFAQATADTQHTGLDNPDGPNPDRRQSSFADDSGNAHIRRFFRSVINASVMAAHLIFGHPKEDKNRPP